MGQLVAAAHQAEQLILVDFAPHELARRTTVRQDREAIADGQRMLNVVGDEDDAQALRPCPNDVSQDDGRLLHAQCGCRLVENEDASPEILRAGDRQRLSFAA